MGTGSGAELVLAGLAGLDTKVWALVGKNELSTLGRQRVLSGLVWSGLV
jgi:hypothetical protein